MTRLLNSIALAAPDPGTDTPLSWKEAVGFLLVTALLMTAGFVMKLEFYLMLLALGGLAALVILRSPMTWIVLSIAGHGPVFWTMTDSFTAIEAAHAALFYGGLLWWLFHRIVIARQPIQWTVGGALFVLLFVQMMLLIPVSLSEGANPWVMFRELAVLATLLLFIPIAHEANTRMKQKLVGGALVFVLFALSVKNIWMYKQKVVEAVYFWQVGASRSAETFFLIFVTAIIGSAMLVSSWRLRTWLFWAAVFVAGAAATILSFYRTLWVGAFVGLFSMGLLMGKAFWKRAAQYIAIGMVLMAGLYPVLLEDFIPLDVMWTSISSRFESIGEYGQDLSVRNRDAEAREVLNTVDGHWVLGKGLGAPLHFFKLTTLETIHTSWTHNGYAWVLRHYGIVGTLLLFGSYLAYVLMGVRLERRLRTWPGLPENVRFRWRTAVACGIAIIVATMLVSITINQFLSREGGLVFAVLYGLYEAWERELFPSTTAASAPDPAPIPTSSPESA